MERPRVPGPAPERLVGVAAAREPGAPAETGVVLCCGLTTLDVVQEVDAVPAPNEKTVARSLAVTFGGPAANAAATAVALGVTAHLLTAIGSGPVADLVLTELAGAGVEVVDLARGTAAVPAVSTILVTASTGERAVVSVNATRVGDLSAVPADALDGVDVVLVDGHLLESAIELATSARAAGVPVVLDGGSWKPGLERLLALVDHAIVSADFRVPPSVAPDGPVAADGGPWTDDRERLVRRVASFGPSVVACTDGDGPILVLVPASSAEVRSVPVPSDPSRRVVDTVGAGDVLHGAYVAFLACRPSATDPVRVLARAAGVASESVHFRGARGWVAAG